MTETSFSVTISEWGMGLHYNTKWERSMKLELTAISLKRFTVCKPEKGRKDSYLSLVTEMSDLGNFNTMQPLYDDAADRGFAIRSHITNEVREFYFHKEDRAQGELVALIFKPVDSKCPVKEVVILND